MDVYVSTDATGCMFHPVEYIESLMDKYPIMHDWNRHPEKAIRSMTRMGDLEAIRSIDCICNCITPSLWQDIADIAARYGHMDIVEWVNANYGVNWQRVGFIARDAGNGEIASYADGYDIVISNDASADYDDFPLNFGLSGDPMEDRGELIPDWRMQDYDEEFLPEEPNIIGDTEPAYEDTSNYTPFNIMNTGWGFRDDNLKNESITVSEFDEDEDADRVSHRFINDYIPA